MLQFVLQCVLQYVLQQLKLKDDSDDSLLADEDVMLIEKSAL